MIIKHRPCSLFTDLLLSLSLPELWCWLPGVGGDAGAGTAGGPAGASIVSELDNNYVYCGTLLDNNNNR